MPSQQGLRSDDGGDFTEDATAEQLGFGCQAAALIVVQTESSSSELLAEHPVLLPKVIDRVALLLAQPSGDRNQQQSKRVKGSAHWVSLAAKAPATGSVQPAQCEADRIFGHYEIASSGGAGRQRRA
jgi:hypothetical protein